MRYKYEEQSKNQTEVNMGRQKNDNDLSPLSLLWASEQRKTGKR